ncbi:MAG TPA: hypothetical protein VFP84_08825 [Kofleriaceae bacterium]|nr:hypothetical protein [Kofleriaceae bacterium]
MQQEMLRQEMLRQEMLRQEMLRQAAMQQAALQQAVSEENDAALAGAIELQTRGWGRISSRVNGVIGQLEQWSGRSFTVVPSQTGNWGQAHSGGTILFDLSSAMQSDAVLAFRLAHEWGHEVLGHQPNMYNPHGRPRLIASPTQDEDEADVYAGRFLCSLGYDVEQVKMNLRRYPAITGDSHSSGAQRASNVQQGCSAVRRIESNDE